MKRSDPHTWLYISTCICPHVLHICAPSVIVTHCDYSKHCHIRGDWSISTQVRVFVLIINHPSAQEESWGAATDGLWWITYSSERTPRLFVSRQQTGASSWSISNNSQVKTGHNLDNLINQKCFKHRSTLTDFFFFPPSHIQATIVSAYSRKIGHVPLLLSRH